MADVTEQPLLCGDQLLQTFGHFVKIAAKLAEFIDAVSHRLTYPGVETAAGQLPGHAPQTFDRSGERPGQ